MQYILTRNDEHIILDLDYEVTDFVPANMRDDGYTDLYTIEITGAWCDGEEFPLTDAELDEAEAWLYEEVEV